MCRSGGRAWRPRLAVSASLFCLAIAADASAVEPDGSNLSRAHDAYARGAAAFAQGDYGRAAKDLATADALVPAPVTLRAALEAVTLADEPILGTELIERAARSPLDATIARALSAAQARFAHRTASLTVRCEGCLALVDGVPAKIGQRLIVLPGVHVVAMQWTGAPEPRLVSIGADEAREVVDDRVPVSPERPPPPSVKTPEAPAPVADHGVSPAWFVVASVVTGALGVVTIASLIDTANDHATFQGKGCNVTAGPGCSDLQSTGQAAQTRTTWLAASTGVAIAGTALFGAVGVRWRSRRGAGVAVALRGASAFVDLAF